MLPLMVQTYYGFKLKHQQLDTMCMPYLLASIDGRERKLILPDHLPVILATAVLHNILQTTGTFSSCAAPCSKLHKTEDTALGEEDNTTMYPSR